MVVYHPYKMGKEAIKIKFPKQQSRNRHLLRHFAIKQEIKTRSYISRDLSDDINISEGKKGRNTRSYKAISRRVALNYQLKPLPSPANLINAAIALYFSLAFDPFTG